MFLLARNQLNRPIFSSLYIKRKLYVRYIHTHTHTRTSIQMEKQSMRMTAIRIKSLWMVNLFTWQNMFKSPFGLFNALLWLIRPLPLPLLDGMTCKNQNRLNDKIEKLFRCKWAKIRAWLLLLCVCYSSKAESTICASSVSQSASQSNARWQTMNGFWACGSLLIARFVKRYDENLIERISTHKSCVKISLFCAWTVSTAYKTSAPNA